MSDFSAPILRCPHGVRFAQDDGGPDCANCIAEWYVGNALIRCYECGSEEFETINVDGGEYDMCQSCGTVQE